MGFDTLMFVFFKLKTHGCFFENFGIFYILIMFFSISLCLYPCCFCKLLGLCFMHVCSLYDVYHAFMQPLCIALISTFN